MDLKQFHELAEQVNIAAKNNNLEQIKVGLNKMGLIKDPILLKINLMMFIIILKI